MIGQKWETRCPCIQKWETSQSCKNKLWIGSEKTNGHLEFWKQIASAKFGRILWTVKRVKVDDQLMTFSEKCLMSLSQKCLGARAAKSVNNWDQKKIGEQHEICDLIFCLCPFWYADCLIALSRRAYSKTVSSACNCLHSFHVLWHLTNALSYEYQ